MYSISAEKTNCINIGMFLCIPAVCFDIYLSLYFMILFTYLLFLLNVITSPNTAINQAKQQSLILIFLLPQALFNISFTDYEAALFKGASAINFTIALALSAVSFQIYSNVKQLYRRQWGVSNRDVNSFNKLKMCASFTTGFIEELFLRITLFHIVGYDLVAFIVISIASSTIYQLVKTEEDINTLSVVKCLILNAIYTLSLAFTGWMAAPIALKFLTNLGENVQRIKCEYLKGCSFIKVRLNCCTG